MELLAIFICLLVASFTEAAPRNSSSLERIINGDKALDGEVPYQVVLHSKKGYRFCGGVIISPDWILTAAHCIVERTGQLTRPADQILVEYNTVKIDQGSKVAVAKLIYHKGYPKSDGPDIALLRLAEQLKLGQVNAKACKLPEPNQSTALKQQVIVSGYGMQHLDSEENDGHLKKVMLEVAECNLTDEMERQSAICAGRLGVSASRGDSGGPLATMDGVIVGIVSRGPKNTPLIDPTIYTKVSVYREWIQSFTGI